MSDLSKLCDQHKIKITILAGPDRKDDGKYGYDAWRVRLDYNGRQITTGFMCGLGHNGKPPNVADVVSSLVLDSSAGSESFEDFCSNFGYDSDSIKARHIWIACKRMARRLPEFFGEALTAFQNAEH